MTQDKIKGLFIGAALGDSLGAPHERNRNLEYSGKLEYPIIHKKLFSNIVLTSDLGQVTDDTEMTLILIRSILNNRCFISNKNADEPSPDKNSEWRLSRGNLKANSWCYDQTMAIKLYLEWANDKKNFFLGRNTRALFCGVKTINGYVRRVNKIVNTNNLQSNGALMRCSPLAFFNDIDIKNDCFITNPNDLCYNVNLVYCHAIKNIYNGETDMKKIIDYAINESNEKIQEFLNYAKNKNDININNKNKGWCLYGLYCAFYSILHFDNYKDGIDWVINKGGRH